MKIWVNVEGGSLLEGLIQEWHCHIGTLIDGGKNLQKLELDQQNPTPGYLFQYRNCEALIRGRSESLPPRSFGVEDVNPGLRIDIPDNGIQLPSMEIFKFLHHHFIRDSGIRNHQNFSLSFIVPENGAIFFGPLPKLVNIRGIRIENQGSLVFDWITFQLIRTRNAPSFPVKGIVNAFS